MMKIVSMPAGLSLTMGDTAALSVAPMPAPTKARRSKAAFVRSLITNGSKHKSQAIRANRRKAKIRSKRCLG